METGPAGDSLDQRVGGDITETLAIAKNSVFVANRQGLVFARDAGTGAMHWTNNMRAEKPQPQPLPGPWVENGEEEASNGQISGREATTEKPGEFLITGDKAGSGL